MLVIMSLTSPDGEPWVGMFGLLNNIYTEGVQQNITLEAGVTYDITFEQAYINKSGGFGSGTNDGLIQVLIDAGDGTTPPTTIIGDGGTMSAWGTFTGAVALFGIPKALVTHLLYLGIMSLHY